MDYIPNTDQQRQEMLQTIGVNSTADLFVDVKKQNIFLKSPLKLPKGMSEIELRKHLSRLAEKNADSTQFRCFLGAGSYYHFSPALVNHMIMRGEFYTAYTPYQPEASQGMLQSIFEWQSYICLLTGMDASNASAYDGSTALAEAMIAAYNIHKKQRKEMLVSSAINPQYRAVLRTYAWANGIDYREIPFENGVTSLNALQEKISENTAGIFVQHPNFLGCLENLAEIEKICHAKNSVFTVCIGDATSLAILKPPGEFNADIVVGDAQAFGIPMSFGGPYAGFMAVKNEHVRDLPGRIVGKTLDIDGRDGYVLTLQAREQHIRREKASSNICTNEALIALWATIHITSLGKCGLAAVADGSLQRAHYLAEQLSKLKGLELVFKKAPFFNEFVVRCKNSKKLQKALLNQKFLPGYDLGNDYPQLKNCLLFCATEVNSKEGIDKLVEAIKKARL